MFNKELNGACSTMIVLGLLARGESYGYEIIQMLKGQSGGRLEWAEGMLYPLLRRLEKDGNLKSRWVTQEGERRRRYYSLTNQGKKALIQEREQWQEANSLMEKIWKLNPTMSS